MLHPPSEAAENSMAGKTRTCRCRRLSSMTDFQAVEDGYVSVTPLHLDLTNYKLLEEIRGWDLAL